MGSKDTIRLLVGAVGAAIATTSALVPLTHYGKAGVVVGVVVLLAVIVWLEVDVRSQPVPTEHRDRLREIARDISMGGLADPGSLDRAGVREPKDRANLESHFLRLRWQLWRWRRHYSAEERARAASMRHIEDVVNSFHLQDPEPLQDWLWWIAKTRATTTAPPPVPSASDFESKEDGSVHLMRDGRDHLIGGSGGQQLVDRLNAVIAEAADWPGTKTWHDAWSRLDKTKSAVMDMLAGIQRRVVIRGHCHDC